MNTRDEDLEGKIVQDAMNNINPEYFEWLKEISYFNVSRTLEICTFILNLMIAQNYFNWMKEIKKNFPFVVPDNLSNQKIKQFNATYEKIYGIFILMNMIYNSNNRLTRSETDKAIDRLNSNSFKTTAFFIIN